MTSFYTALTPCPKTLQGTFLTFQPYPPHLVSQVLEHIFSFLCPNQSSSHWIWLSYKFTCSIFRDILIIPLSHSTLYFYSLLFDSPWHFILLTYRRHRNYFTSDLWQNLVQCNKVKAHYQFDLHYIN